MLRINKKHAILAILVGHFFGWFLGFGINYKWFQDKPIATIFYIIFGAILLYVSVYGIVKNRLNLAFGLTGILISRFTFALLAITINYITQYQYDSRPKKTYQKPKLIMDSIACSKVKYGRFTNGIDTIKRFKENGKIYQETKSYTSKTNYRIKWMSPCSYLEITKTGLALKLTELGNFQKDLSHDVYIKPPGFHDVSVETFSRYYQIIESPTSSSE